MKKIRLVIVSIVGLLLCGFGIYSLFNPIVNFSFYHAFIATSGLLGAVGSLSELKNV